MLIVEHFFLIACDPRVGLPTLPRRTPSVNVVAAAALLLDLAVHQRLSLHGSVLRVDAHMPLTHPLLADALHAMHSHPELSVPSLLATLARRLHRLPEQVLDGLFRRDILHRNERRRWLLWKQVTYPLRSVQARNEAMLCLRQATGASEDLHGLALLLLADVSGLLPVHLEAREYEQAVARLLALNPPDAQADEPHRIFSSIRAALLA